MVPRFLVILVPFVALAGYAGCAREELSTNRGTSVETSVEASAAPRATTSAGEAPPPAPPSLAPRDDPKLPMPGPNRRRMRAAVSENASCEGCHDDIAREWRGSYHQRANLDPAYRAALAAEPSPFCQGCHAPEADPRAEPPPPVSALGVGCVTCHVTERGVVLAATHPDDSGRPTAPHPLRRSHDFAHEGGCAGCHEFRFPFPGGPDDAAFMQTTVREHGRSPAAARPCAACHMPLRDGRRSHAFTEVRDEAWLRASLTATAERTTEGVRVTLTPRDPGHDFPTGDLFRRLEVGVSLTDEEGKILHREVRYLARHFRQIQGLPGRHLEGDDRVQGEAKRVDLDLPSLPAAGRASRLAWWVTYQRVATIGKGIDPETAVIESEVLLQAGNLPFTPDLPSVPEP